MEAALCAFICCELHIVGTLLHKGGALTGRFWFLLEHSFSYSPVSAEMVPTICWCCSVLALLTFYLTGRFHVNV